MKYNFDKQHMKGKLHARERIDILLDKNSFHEIGSEVKNINYITKETNKKLEYDGVITGYGRINGNIVYVYSQDFTVNGGSLGLNHGKKISHIIKLAIQKRCPVIGIIDSAGARIQEGVSSLAGYGDVFAANAMASGYILQISIIAGNCAGGAVYSPALTDFIFVIDKISRMFVTGPQIVCNESGKKISLDELGGAMVHAAKSGVAHFYYKNEYECIEAVRFLVDLLCEYLIGNTKASIQKFKDINKSLEEIVPNNFRKAYDVREVLNRVLDEGIFLEVHKYFACNVVVGFGKIGNYLVGIVANQPNTLAGAIDCDASDKASRFVCFCDAFNIPIITFVDLPGFLPGVKQEYKGIIRHGAKLLYAYSAASTIKITIILRKAYGGAYVAMGSKHLGADFVYSWPNAEIAVMGAENAVSILYKKEIDKLENEEQKSFKAQRIEEYKERYINVSDALESGYIDEIIKPNNTKRILYDSLIALEGKRGYVSINKKHGCAPT